MVKPKAIRERGTTGAFQNATSKGEQKAPSYEKGGGKTPHTTEARPKSLGVTEGEQGGGFTGNFNLRTNHFEGVTTGETEWKRKGGGNKTNAIVVGPFLGRSIGGFNEGYGPGYRHVGATSVFCRGGGAESKKAERKYEEKDQGARTLIQGKVRCKTAMSIVKKIETR